MGKRHHPGDGTQAPANDNGGRPVDMPLDPRLREIARAIGRQIAREMACPKEAMNDNDPVD